MPVDYAYEDGLSISDSGGSPASYEAKYVRLNSVTYPGPATRRAIYYNYDSRDEFAPLNRVANIADEEDATPNETYAAYYTYKGAGSVVNVAYPQVDVSGEKLAMKHWSTGSTYPGLDRLGRVIQQKWAINTTVKDQFDYAYDGSSNRISRDVGSDMGTPPAGLDDYYEYDGLDRLVQSNRGDLAGGVIDEEDADENQAWTLDAVGNWSQFKWDADGGADSWTTQTRAHNKANEIEGVSGRAKPAI